MIRTHGGNSLRHVGSFSARSPRRPPALIPHPLAHEVADAVATAVKNARARLATRLPHDALDSLGQYFEAPTVHAWNVSDRPELAEVDLFAELCALPRSVTVRDKAAGLQLELRTLDEKFEVEALGDPVEPGSDVLMLSPTRLAAAAAKNTSIELRQFDRQCASWAPFADDLAAVTGADIFLKLFVADGNRSVNGWHRDASDVLVTLLHGAKRFAVATSEHEEPDAEPKPVVDVVLRAGDLLRLPRAMLHCATPDGDLSALLSMGLMRVADWPLRQVPPTHLGFRDYPRSAGVYQLCLRAHVPPTPSTNWDPTTATLRTRMPGGISILEIHNEEVSFIAAGSVYETSEQAVRVLGRIHASDGISAVDLAADVGVSEPACISMLDEFLEHGLVRLQKLTA
jgi:hypothetical protein